MDKLKDLLKRPEDNKVNHKKILRKNANLSSIEKTSEIREISDASQITDDADDIELLEQVDLDPEIWKVQSVRRSNWQGGADGAWRESLKVYAVRRYPENLDKEEISYLKDQISILEPIRIPRPTRSKHKSTFLVMLSDWQIGKGEGGGAAATVSRITTTANLAAARLKELIASGRKVERIALVGLGDLVEGCSGWYASQEWQTELTRREQVNVTRRLLITVLRTFAEFKIPITMATVAGNHGENRKDGKAFTTFGDNDDVAVFEQVYDIVSINPKAFCSPEFVIPGDDLTIALDLSGVIVGAAHGHQAIGGGIAQAKIATWWQKQALGSRPVASAQILLTGHYHHFSCVTHGMRTHFQAPSLDGGSAWFTETSGVSSPPGLVTMLIGKGMGDLGWSDLLVIPATI